MASAALVTVFGFIRSPVFFPVLSMALQIGASIRWAQAGSLGQAAWWALGVVSTFILTFVIGGSR